MLNHLDYIAPEVARGCVTAAALEFVKSVERQIDRKVDWVGVSPSDMIDCTALMPAE